MRFLPRFPLQLKGTCHEILLPIFSIAFKGTVPRELWLLFPLHLKKGQCHEICDSFFPLQLKAPCPVIVYNFSPNAFKGTVERDFLPLFHCIYIQEPCHKSFINFSIAIKGTVPRDCCHLFSTNISFCVFVKKLQQYNISCILTRNKTLYIQWLPPVGIILYSLPLVHRKFKKPAHHSIIEHLNVLTKQ